MSEDPNITHSDPVKKPRKRFVGKAKKAASESNELGAIEDGAVGFASKQTKQIIYYSDH